MSNTYTQLTYIKRQELEILVTRGYRQEEIAKVLTCHQSTISRELTLGYNSTSGRYEALHAQTKMYLRKQNQHYVGKKIEEDKELKHYIIEALKQKKKPDVIAGRMRREGQVFYVNKDTIYRWLYSSLGAQYCYLYLTKRCRTKKHKKNKTTRQLIPRRRWIEERVLGIVGNLEGDTIVSGKKTKSTAGIAVLFDRDTKYLSLKKVTSMSPSLVMPVYQMSLSSWNHVTTCTFDNGIENAHHLTLGVPTFFCHPHHPWEKGGIEQSNKLIREYITKGSDISTYTDEYVHYVEELLNNMPRKSIDYRTPREYMIELGQLNMQLG
jgi:transposase, IS30 family